MEHKEQPGESELAKKVKTLLEKEENVLAQAVATTMKNYHKDPTVKNLNEWDAARARYEKYKKEQEAQADPSSRRFKTLNGKDGVLEYLQSEGWKVEKSKLDKDKHKIKKEADGSYTRKAVDEYASYFLERRDGSDANLSDEARRKATADADFREQQLKKIKLENEIDEGKWVLKSEVEQKHTAKLALLMTAVENFIHGGKLDEACELVGGSKEKVIELKAFFKKEFRSMLGEYAKRPEFTVPVAAVAEAEELIKEMES